MDVINEMLNFKSKSQMKLCKGNGCSFVVSDPTLGGDFRYSNRGIGSGNKCYYSWL